MDQNVNLQVIAVSCNGYVGADLEALCQQAASLANCRSQNSTVDGCVLTVRMEDWESAKLEIGPSITRGITKEVPKVSWDDIGGLQELKVWLFFSPKPTAICLILVRFYYINICTV